MGVHYSGEFLGYKGRVREKKRLSTESLLGQELHLLPLSSVVGPRSSSDVDENRWG